MRKSGLLVLFILILIAVILGISAGDLWGYILDFTKIAFAYLTDWVKTVIEAIRESLAEGVSGAGDYSDWEDGMITVLRYLRI